MGGSHEHGQGVVVGKNLAVMGALSLSLALLAGCNGDEGEGGSSSSTGGDKAAVASSQNSGKSSAAAGGDEEMKLPIKLSEFFEGEQTTKKAAAACQALFGSPEKMAEDLKVRWPGKAYNWMDYKRVSEFKDGDLFPEFGMAAHNELYCQAKVFGADDGAGMTIGLWPDTEVEHPGDKKVGNIFWRPISSNADASYAVVNAYRDAHLKDVVE